MYGLLSELKSASNFKRFDLSTTKTDNEWFSLGRLYCRNPLRFTISVNGYGTGHTIELSIVPEWISSNVADYEKRVTVFIKDSLREYGAQIRAKHFRVMVKPATKGCARVKRMQAREPPRPKLGHPL